MGDPLQRGGSQAAVPGLPSLLPTASGIGLAGDAPQDNAPQQGVYVLKPLLGIPAARMLHSLTHRASLCTRKHSGKGAAAMYPCS